MSRKRLAIGGVLALAVLAGAIALLAGVGSSKSDELEPVELADEDLQALTAAACPPRYEVLRAGEFTDAEVETARRGRFVINGETVELEPEVDWTINPQGARAFSHTLFKFQWIDPLLYAYRTEGDTEALEQATALALDFARANPPNGEPIDPDVWDDKRTGDRAPYLAYVLRAAECEGLLAAEERALLMRLIMR
ncbi:MAG TPA: hypothetical protein VKA36_08050, partial [Solirubrobacterales bacterium]|nr:hypothetical protein [Solirubrobacterales bacterium]